MMAAPTYFDFLNGDAGDRGPAKKPKSRKRKKREAIVENRYPWETEEQAMFRMIDEDQSDFLGWDRL